MKRILYVSPNSIFDQSSGAAIGVRTLLKALGDRGHTVRALNATVFDQPEGGKLLSSMVTKPLQDNEAFLVQHGKNYVTTVRTQQSRRTHITAQEEARFFSVFLRALDDLKPDVIVTWGAGILDLAIMEEARRRDIPVVFNLVNPSYEGERWKRYATHFITDSQATSRYYGQTQGLDVQPIGHAINPDDYRAEKRDPKYFTFVNPQAAKGAAFFIKLALKAQDELPAARFLVVEGRGKWLPALHELGLSPKKFTNVDVAPLQDNMRSVYAQTRTLLVPSYMRESGPRVALEAMLNGIPVLGAAHGGIPEAIGAGGHTYEIPESVRKNRTVLPSDDDVNPWIEEIKRHVRDAQYYEALSQAALDESRRYDLDKTVDRFLAVIADK
jgi:glycosyltransferase involved in cell wall biosynthesis